MAKEKTSKAVQNKHIYSRASYLYQAAAYLSAQGHGSRDVVRVASTSSSVPNDEPTTGSDSADTTQAAPADTKSSVPTIHASSSSPTADDTTTTSAYASQPHGSQRRLITHLRGICRKSQIRLSQDIKRSICKCCDILLIPGRTCTAGVENESKGGKKERADVYVVRCLGCGGVKRFPVGMERQKAKGGRGEKAKESEGKNDGKMNVDEIVQKREDGIAGDVREGVVVDKGEMDVDVPDAGEKWE